MVCFLEVFWNKKDLLSHPCKLHATADDLGDCGEMFTILRTYCYGSSHNSVLRVLVPLIQAENTLEVFRYIPMISAPQHSH